MIGEEPEESFGPGADELEADSRRNQNHETVFGADAALRPDPFAGRSSLPGMVAGCQRLGRPGKALRSRAGVGASGSGGRQHAAARAVHRGSWEVDVDETLTGRLDRCIRRDRAMKTGLARELETKTPQMRANLAALAAVEASLAAGDRVDAGEIARRQAEAAGFHETIEAIGIMILRARAWSSTPPAPSS